jgi:aminoglycoside 6'-N-acetyltransferase I
MRCALWPDEAPSDLQADVTAYSAGRSVPALQHVLLAEDEDGRAVGFAELSIRPYAEGCETDRVAFLEGWYVVPDARRRGVGRLLIASAERWARGQGCSELASDALLDNAVSAAAHAALGFGEAAQLRCFRKSLTETA